MLRFGNDQCNHRCLYHLQLPERRSENRAIRFDHFSGTKRRQSDFSRELPILDQRNQWRLQLGADGNFYRSDQRSLCGRYDRFYQRVYAFRQFVWIFLYL